MRALAAVVLALAAQAAFADDAAPAPDSIAAAKKDLAEIKGAPGSQDLGSALPALDLKDMGPVPGARIDAPALIPSEKDSLDPAKKKEGTGNWLVDAMEKPDGQGRDPKAKEKDEQLKADLALLRGDDRKSEKDALALDETRERDAPRDEPEKVSNPLDSFMSSWVSAKDHDLLVSKPEPAGGPETLPGLEGAQAAPADLLLPSAADVQSFSGMGAANPYIAAFELQAAAPLKPLGPAEVTDFGLAAFPDLSRGISSGAEARPIDGARGIVPDFAQPSDDDKYFKQLKRF